MFETASDFFSVHSRVTSDTGSTPVSPGTVVTASTAPRVRPSLANHRRSRTDYDALHSKVRIHTIDEDVPASHVTKNSLKPGSSQWSQSSDSLSSKPTNAAAARYISSGSLAHIIAHNDSQAHKQPISVVVRDSTYSARTRPGHRWLRTPSGGVWYETRTSSGRGSKQTSTSTDITSGFQGNRPFEAPVPLRPPAQHNVSGSGYHHSIKMETSFTNLQSHHSPPKPIESAQKSFHSGAVLSATIARIRQFGRKKTTTKIPIVKGMAEVVQEPLDHNTSLKPVPTGVLLRQVSAMLRATSGDRQIKFRGKPPLPGIISSSAGSLSQESRSTPESKELPKSPTFSGFATHRATHRKKSDPTMLVSDTSSIRRIKMGQTPRGTPDDEATYKVKRSSSAMTETYLRIDISIRGGTSYLPSEARRIHTPPLPDEEPGRKRRGFFFDYEAHVEGGEKRKRKSRQGLDSDGHGTEWQHAHSAKPIRPGTDWYDTQLADLESSGASSGSHDTTMDEEQLDYNIPEHLPSSPLCPRHARYWRVVDGKGSQYRGCWMHGYGVYQTVELKWPGR